MGVPYRTMIQSHKMGVLDSLHQASKNAKAEYNSCVIVLVLVL
jgi:hypothetical protein